MSRTRTIAAGLILGSFLLFGAASASAVELPGDLPIEPLTYKIHTVYEPAGDDRVEATNQGVLVVPTPVNVDGDLTTGVAGAEVLVQLTIDAGRATLRATKLPGAPAEMPLLLEAILSDPRGGSTLRVAFGYDTLDATAPDVYNATIQLIGAARVTSFSLDVETVGAGDTLSVIAEVFSEGQNGERANPQRGRVRFTPVPTTVHFGLLQGSDLGTQQSGVDLSANVPTKAEVTIQDIQGAHETRGDITIDSVPTVLSLILTDSADGKRTWNYQATDRVDLIDLSIRETEGASIVDEFALRLENMSLTAVLVQDTETHATLQADMPIGVVQAGSSTDGPIAWRDDPAYVFSSDRNGDSLAFRVLGLQRAEIDSRDPFLIDVQMQAGPFHVVVEQDTLDVDAWIRDLPGHIRLTFSPSAGTAEWETSEPIGSVEINATDPEGIGGRATRLHVLLDQIPTGIAVAWGEQSGEARLEARNGRIGSVTLLLTSGPDLEVDEGFDGVVLEDVTSHYALAARLTGLRLVSVTTGDAPYTASLRKTAGPFLVRLDRGAQRARLEVLDLPDSLDVTFDPNGTLTYTGSAPIDAITAEVTDPAGIAGRATRLSLRIDDVPASMTLGFDTDEQAVIDANGGRVGSFELLLTSGPFLTVDPGFDGIVIEDVTSHFAAAVRLTGLRSISVSTGDAPYQLLMEKDPRAFIIRLDEQVRSARITIRDLPAEVDATLDPAGSLTYAGSGPIDSLDAEITDPAGVAGRATFARATIRQIPTTLDITWDSSGGRIGADAGGGTVGLLEVLLTSGPDATLPAEQDGVLLHDLADRYVVFARLTGLRAVTFEQGPPPSITLQTGGGRMFVVDVRRTKPSGIATTSATVNTLPASLTMRFTNATTFAYTASSAVQAVQLDAFDPDGISGRANTLHATIANLPTAFDVAWNSTGQITLDAKGGTIGSIELQLTSGPNDRLDPSFDGLLLNDLADRYVLFARMTGLRRVTGTQQPRPDITLETTGGRILKIELNQLDGGKVEYTRATLDRLPSSVRVRMLDKQIFYDASAPTNSLVFDTNSGDRDNMHADISNPLPARIAFCAASDGFCNGYARSSGAGSFSFDASEHTSVNLFDCVRPLGGCSPGNASVYTQVSNWRVRHFDFDADSDDVAFEGYTYNNTNGHAAQGYLKRIDGSNGFEADIRPGYSSSNRKVEWSWWGADKDKSGSVNCAGSSFSVRVFGIWIGVTGYVC